MKTNRFLFAVVCVSVLMFSAWTVYSQTASTQNQPTDFNATNPDDYPQTNVINILIKGISDYGTIYMLEGMENTTSVEVTSNNYSAGKTSYPRLVLHGVFSKLMRDWRAGIISGTTTKRDIQVDLMNKAGKRVLRVTFYGAFPVSFSLPPLSVDSNTRYMERMEFVYTNFDITN